MAEWEAEDCRSGEGNEASGLQVVGVAGDMTARAGRRPCTGRSDEASTAASRGAARRFLHGRWVARFGDPLRGGERRSRWASKRRSSGSRCRGLAREPHRLAPQEFDLHAGTINVCRLRLGRRCMTRIVGCSPRWRISCATARRAQSSCRLGPVSCAPRLSRATSRASATRAWRWPGIMRTPRPPVWPLAER